MDVKYGDVKILLIEKLQFFCQILLGVNNRTPTYGELFPLNIKINSRVLNLGGGVETNDRKGI